jgi:hypothetical protein
MNRTLSGKFSAILFIAFFLCSGPLFAQNYEKEFETLFAWEVKQIDEFIERFNNTDKTLIRQYSKKVDPTKELNREKLIKSLFNAEDRNWDFNDINSFISKVNSYEQPVYLNFFDKDWYAKINCSVTWKGRPEKATLILKIDRNQSGESKWIITGVQANFLQVPLSASIQIPHAQDPYTSLNPVSHATDFMNLDQVLRDKKNIVNYFKTNGNGMDELTMFMNECLQNRLFINKVNAISYHFLQIEDWILEIQQFNRQTKNSGWLISKLIKASPEDKEQYRILTLKQ